MSQLTPEEIAEIRETLAERRVLQGQAKLLRIIIYAVCGSVIWVWSDDIRHWVRERISL